MKFAGKHGINVDSLGEASVSLVPVEPEDMWHANNLIRPGDTLRARAVRKVVEESATGSTTSSRVQADLTIRVVSLRFDPCKSALQVSGVVVVENSITNLGQYHTLDLELHRPFTLRKQHGWDSIASAELREALREDKANAIAAVVMTDQQANICEITESQTIVRARIAGNTPKKLTTTASSSTAQKLTNKYFDDVLVAVLDVAAFSDDQLQQQQLLLILASPGYTAQNFRNYIAARAERMGDARLRRLARGTQVVHSSTGNVHSLNEALANPQVLDRLMTAKFSAESRLMDDLLAKLRSDDESVSTRVTYGAVPVARAVDEGAVGRGGGVLLINNALFRNNDVTTRKHFVAIVDKVKEAGGEVRLLSSDHESGQRLDNLGGIAALLTYPLQYHHDSDGEDGQATAAADEDRDMVV